MYKYQENLGTKLASISRELAEIQCKYEWESKHAHPRMHKQYMKHLISSADHLYSNLEKVNEKNTLPKSEKTIQLQTKADKLIKRLQRESAKYTTNLDNYQGKNDNQERCRQILIHYVQYLYNMLNDLNVCFLSGAFVIDDQGKKLQGILSKARDMTLPWFARSHTRFNPTLKDSTVCNGVCEVHIETGDLEIRCREGGRAIENIKFYTFSDPGQDNVRERFVYLKCESHKTFSPKHMYSATRRYKLKIDKKGDKRREDCKTEEKCQCKKNNCEEKFPGDPEVILADTIVRSDDGSTGRRVVVEDNKKEYRNDGNSDEFSVHYKVNDLILNAIKMKKTDEIFFDKPSEDLPNIKWERGVVPTAWTSNENSPNLN